MDLIPKDPQKTSTSQTDTSTQAEHKAEKRFKEMKEEISLELSELGNTHPKQEPMTPNQRHKSEKEKPY